jgi:hypothetical protein
MALNWPGTYTSGGELPSAEQESAKALLEEFATNAEFHLSRMGLRVHDSPLWRPWNLVVIQGPQNLFAAFSAFPGGMADLRWLDWRTLNPNALSVADAIREQLGRQIDALVTLPLPGSVTRVSDIEMAAQNHAEDVERASRLSMLGDLTGIGHLEPYLREFLAAHPTYEKNVFIMMRFITSPQLDEVYASIKSSLKDRGFDAVRADDRDYTGELWSNIEVHLTGCKYGIAVFEDFAGVRDFNPNVSLELGYMLGRRKRVLILKEQSLPALPADVVHRLYKPFEMFNLSTSVSREVGRWIDVDLGLGIGGRA